MKLLLVASTLLAAVSAAPQGYGVPRPYGDGGPGPINCGPNEVLNVDGTCAIPVHRRQVFVYTAPEQPKVYRPPPQLPQPELHTNIVFIRVPEDTDDVDHIVVPPPRQKNIVYVLNKRRPDGGQRVIEVPAPPASNPEVYFVNYNEGDNPTLPGGYDLNSALSSATHNGGRVIDGGDGHGGYGGDVQLGGGGGFVHGGDNYGDGPVGGGGGGFVHGSGAGSQPGGLYP